MRQSTRSHVFALTTILFWSLAYVLTRMALKYFSAFPLGLLRYAAASVAMLVFVLAMKIKAPKKEDWIWVLLSGFFGFFLYMISFNKGCETATASTSSVVIATVPAITAVLARVFFGEKLALHQWIATAVELSGVVCMTLLGRIFSLNTGLVWLILAALSLSAYNILQRKLTKSNTGLQSSAFSIFAGTLMLCIFLPSTTKEAAAAPGIAFVYVIILGVFSSAAAYACWTQALKTAKKTTSVSNYMFITPFLTTLLGFLLAKETPDMTTIIGGSVILLGAMLFNFGGILRKQKDETNMSH